MKEKEYIQLENLLSKLEKEVGNKIILMPNHNEYGFYLKVYMDNGIVLSEYGGSELKYVIQKLKIKLK